MKSDERPAIPLEAQKMEVLGRLATAVIHDLNNLLTVIQLNAGLIESGGFSAEEQTEAAEKISQASQRAAELTRKVLHFARRKPSESQDVDMHDVFDALLRLLEPLIARQVEVEVGGDRGDCWVHGDRGAIEQAVLNLVLNAVESMPSGGRVGLSARVEPIEGARGVVISVTDEGEGIPPDAADAVFEPFYTSKNSGTGMGLAIVQRVAEAHGGSVSYQARPGGGTEFLLRLPAAIAKTTATSVGATSLPLALTGRVLFVEDDPGIRELTRHLLAADGLEVFAAGSGEAAWEIWRERSGGIDLLFTDVVLPGMSGVDLARRIHDEKPALPVLYTSGFAGAWGANANLNESNFLAKPFRREELRRALAGLISG